MKWKYTKENKFIRSGGIQYVTGGCRHRSGRGVLHYRRGLPDRCRHRPHYDRLRRLHDAAQQVEVSV